jgi:hypothetical protein
MQIRPEQLAALKDASLANFEQQLAGHCRTFAPNMSERAGATKVREFVHTGVQRARGHGFTLRGPMRLYLELMLSCGCDFDTDPQLPWAREALAADPASDEMPRAKALYQAMQGYAGCVYGAGREHAIGALGRLSRLSPADWSKLSGPFEARLEQFLRAIFPQKLEYSGMPAVAGLIPRAAETASGFSVRLEMAVVLLLTLSFTFGHGAATDPMYAWVPATLADPKTPNPQDRVAQLYDRIRSYAESALAELPKGD